MSHKIEVIDGNVCIHIGTTPVADLYRHIEVMTPDEARSFVADVTAAIESIAPVRIDRWLTPADIEKYGDRWEWHSVHWGQSLGEMYPMPSAAKKRKTGSIDVVASGLAFQSSDFDSGDYFTPIKGEK